MFTNTSIFVVITRLALPINQLLNLPIPPNQSLTLPVSSYHNTSKCVLQYNKNTISSLYQTIIIIDVIT